MSASPTPGAAVKKQSPWRELHQDRFSGRHVVITGGAGFIGSHLAGALLHLGARVTIIDNLDGGSRDNIRALTEGSHNDALRFVEASILNTEALAAATRGAELVFHQAALGSVPRSVAEPVRFHDVNTTGTLNVLEAARAAGVRRVMFAASSSAYGDSEVLPKVETMPPASMSPYAASKVAGEALLCAYANCYPLDAVALRYFNVFGSRQNANSAYAAVIAAFAAALLAGRRPIIYGDGSQSRDFTHVDNVVHANLLAARHDQRLGGAVVNVGCGRAVTVAELARQMAAEMGRPDLLPVHEPPRAGDVKHSLADLSRASSLLGYEPVVDLEQGLRETVAWYAQASGAR